MVSRKTTLVPSLGLRIGPACDCEAGFSAGMRRERVPPRIRKKEESLNLCGFFCSGTDFSVRAITRSAPLHLVAISLGVTKYGVKKGARVDHFGLSDHTDFAI